MKGYKVFDPDWTCRGFQYEVGQTYEMDGEPKCCDRGFHFCTKAADCFNFYSFDPENKVAEVEAFGEIDVQSEDENSKCCTNKIHIVRELTWYEVLDLVNSGKNCTGLCNSGNCNSGNYNSGDRNSGNYNSGNYNSGNCNSGNYNSGDCNSGDRNSGDYNSGDWNSGDRNSGNYNSGDCNSGDWNSGDRNSGDYNSGDWNKCSFSNGCFNTVSTKIYLFNKPSEWTYRDWLNSNARYLLNQIPGNVLEYIYLSDMTDEEKAAHPEAKTTGGYLKILDNSECAVIWWRGLSDRQKAVITAIPNFDKEIFKQITGIDVDAD